jgi:hypothetical protein
LGILLLAAFKGKEPQGSASIEAAIDLGRARGEGMAVQIGLWTIAVLSNGLARYEQARLLSMQAWAMAPGYMFGPWALPELIEAAVRTGNEGEAVVARGWAVLGSRR